MNRVDGKPTWAQVLEWRLSRQGVGQVGADGDPVGLTRRLCGLHAQVTSSAELAAGVRDPGLPAGAVRRALWDDKLLVKTWLMRGTLHLVAGEDLPAYVAASRLRDFHLRPSWLKQNRITVEEITRIIEVVPKVLSGRCLTREELASEVSQALGDPRFAEALGNGFGELLKPVAFHGGLCFGPARGRRVTFVHPRDWLPGDWHEPSGEEAQRLVLRRFLGAHGPASPADFGRWWGVTATAARRFGELLGEEIVTLEVEGRSVWALREHVSEIAAHREERALRLLPGFDPYIVSAPRDVEQVVARQYRDRVYRFAGWFSAVVLIGGRVVGTWRHQHKRDRLLVGVEVFEPLTAAAGQELRAEVDRLAAVLGGVPEISLSQAG